MTGVQTCALPIYIPISIVTDGMGLNITVHSYLDRLDFGLIACRELVPDLWDLLDMHFDEIALLCDVYGVDHDLAAEAG